MKRNIFSSQSLLDEDEPQDNMMPHLFIPQMKEPEKPASTGHSVELPNIN